MKKFYAKYRDEILTILSIASPIVVAFFSDRFLKTNILKLIYSRWYVYLPWVFLLISAAWTFILYNRLSAQRKRDLISPLEIVGPRHRNVLDEALDTYYLLGMSAEEFQRNVPIKEYFLSRVRSDHPFKEIRILLLHPDSVAFRDRILEVNADCDLEAMIQRKKEIIHSFYLGFKSLPQGTIKNFEIRFYSTYPIWIMQFYNSRKHNSPTRVPDSLALLSHPQGTHSKFSAEYFLQKGNNPLYDSFMNYFEHQWEIALPTDKATFFPHITSTIKRDLKLILLDFDGVIVETAELKKAALLSLYKDLSTQIQEKVTDIYVDNEGLAREELFQIIQSEIWKSHLSENQLAAKTTQYASYYKATSDRISLVKGFDVFCQLFSRQWQFAVVSNAPLDEIRSIVNQLGVDDWFSHIYGRPITKVKAIESLMQSQKLLPSNMIYIGDTKEDLSVSQSLGIEFYARKSKSKLKLPVSEEHAFSDFYELIHKLIKDELV